MKQTSAITRKLAENQETSARNRRPIVQTSADRLYRLYVGEVTEVHDSRALNALITRYFSSATILHASGIWQGQPEPCTIVEVIGTVADWQSIAQLADAIRVTWKQESVYVTSQALTAVLDVRAPEALEPLRTFDDIGRR